MGEVFKPSDSLDPKKLEQNLYGLANFYTDKIRTLAGRLIEGAAEKVDDIKTYIIDQAATINEHIAQKGLEDLSKTTDPVKRAQIIEACTQMCQRRLKVFEALFAKSKPETYEDMARAADLYRAGTELAKDQKTTDLAEAIGREVPLNDGQLSYLVDLIDGGKWEAQAEKEGNGEESRKYLQIGIGALLYKMCFDQKVIFANAYINKKGFAKFNQLAEMMMFTGGLSPNDYKELLEKNLAKPLQPVEKVNVQKQLAKFNDPKYLEKTNEMVKAWKDAYGKAAQDMRQDHDENPFQSSVRGKNFVNVVGSVVLGATVVFNVLAVYMGNPTWAERVAAAPQNLPLVAGGAGLVAISSNGSASVAAEKFSLPNAPKERAQIKDKNIAALLEQNSNDVPFGDWLAKGGMGVLMSYHEYIKNEFAKSKNIDPDSSEGRRQFYAGNPSLVDAGKLVEFIKSDTNKSLPGRMAIMDGLNKLANNVNYQTRINEMLNNTLKMSINAKIFSQADYVALLEDYKKNRNKYKLA